jgi:hypothetical protein
LPQVRDPQYRKSGVPKAGLALLFVKDDRSLLLLAYRTSEIANDRYAYAEVLQQVRDGEARIARQAWFFLDIAGIEGIEWPILWPLNFVLLVSLWRLIGWTPWTREERWGGLAGGLCSLPLLAYLNQNAFTPRAYSVDEGGLVLLPLLNLLILAVSVLLGRTAGRLARLESMAL